MIVFRTHRPQLFAIGTLAGLFGLSGLTRAWRDASRFRRLSGGMGGVYFAFQASHFFRVALVSEALILGKEGLVDRVGSPPAGFLPWEHVASAEVVSIPLGLLVRKFIGIRLRSTDGKDVGRARPPFEPPLFGEFAALIPEYTLEERVEDVVESLKYYIEDADERAELESLLYAPGRPRW